MFFVGYLLEKFKRVRNESIPCKRMIASSESWATGGEKCFLFNATISHLDASRDAQRALTCGSSGSQPRLPAGIPLDRRTDRPRIALTILDVG